MKTKQKIIQESYRDYWEEVKDIVDADGWCLMYYFPLNIESTHKVINNKDYLRPKSLQGIENNNGWIKIESENDLPKSEVEYFVKRKNVAGIFIRQFVLSHTKSWLKCYTHYQQIIKPQPPIY